MLAAAWGQPADPAPACPAAVGALPYERWPPEPQAHAVGSPLCIPRAHQPAQSGVQPVPSRGSRAPKSLCRPGFLCTSARSCWVQSVVQRCQTAGSISVPKHAGVSLRFTRNFTCKLMHICISLSMVHARAHPAQLCRCPYLVSSTQRAAREPARAGPAPAPGACSRSWTGCVGADSHGSPSPKNHPWLLSAATAALPAVLSHSHRSESFPAASERCWWAMALGTRRDSQCLVWASPASWRTEPHRGFCSPSVSMRSLSLPHRWQGLLPPGLVC